MKKKFILLDIDNTLYDSSSFRKQLFEKIVMLLEKDGITNATSICEEVYSSLIKEKGLFYPEDLLEVLHTRFPSKKISSKELLDVMYSEEFVSSYLYEETHAVIKEFEQLGELGIFSQGIERFQQLKVKQIAHLLKTHHIHIVPSKLSEIQRIFELYKEYEVFFLDDALPVLHAVKKAYPYVFTIWIKRGRYATIQEPIQGFIPNAVVKNLKEAENVIKEQK